MTHGGAGSLRGAGQQRGADQQDERADPGALGHRRAEPDPRHRRIGEQHGDQARERRGDHDGAAHGKQEVSPAGRAGVLPAGLPQQGDSRDRDEETREPDQLHAGR